MCRIVFSLSARGSGPKSLKAPIIPPKIKKKNTRPAMLAIIIATKLGQKTLPNDTFDSVDSVIIIIICLKLV